MCNRRFLLSVIFVVLNLFGCFGREQVRTALEERLENKLTALADSLTKHLKPWKVPASVFDVREFGAVGDGATLNTVAIQKAIDACHGAGGGTVRIAGGEYVTGTIELKSGVMLEVAKGARLLGSTDLKDYPDKVESFQSVMNVVHKYRISLIYAEKAECVGICGKGEIYFRGEAQNFPGPETTGPLEGRPFGIRMIECRNVYLKDITLRNSAAWMQSYIYCRDLIFDGITVFNHANHNNDALDPDGCRNVIVRNCFFSSHDDAMCLKSASAMPCENFLIENSTFYSTCNAFKLGTDTQGDYRNIIARNLVLGGLPDASLSFRNRDDCSTGITLVTVDGGNVEDILMENIEISRSRCPIFLRIGNRGRRLNGPMEHPGFLRNVVIRRIKGMDNRRQGSLISGIKGYPIENVVIRDMDIETVGGGSRQMAEAEIPELEGGYPDAQDFQRDGLPAYGFYVRYARNIRFEQIRVSPKDEEKRPLLGIGKDVENLFLDGAELPDVGYTSHYGRLVMKISSTEEGFWLKSEDRLQHSAATSPVLSVMGTEEGIEWKAWGTTFNELDWNALLMLKRDEQDEILYNLFDPQGDLKFTRGRISMNCNDYGYSWYSCDEVPGDLELRYFNIERDKRTIIPLIRAAQKYNPSLTFWTSPWSPPSWMKINHDYPVVSSRHNQADPGIDYLLYGTVDGIDENEMQFLGERNGKFPRRLATQDYFIQDPRYLQAYAEYFCKFIDAYKEQDVNIDMVIYQNEAYSYTPYPGCAWTAEGTVRFNRDYLAPVLAARHPNVKLYIGTFNTNRQDYVEKILSDEGMRKSINGIAFQWEGREILPEIRQKYPDYHYICSESECGDGSMDWKAGEHTFFLICDNAGNGCDEWFNWNFLLPDRGTSPWGWKQNALIQVNSKTRSFRYTAEYYAVKHFTHYVVPGSRMVGYCPQKEKNVYTIVWLTPQNRYVVVIGNCGDEKQTVSVGFGREYLNAAVEPHSFNTYCIDNVSRCISALATSL